MKKSVALQVGLNLEEWLDLDGSDLIDDSRT